MQAPIEYPVPVEYPVPGPRTATLGKVTTPPLTLPPELDPRGPARGTERRGLRRFAAVVAVVILLTSGLLYGRYVHYNGNLNRATGVITTGGTKATGGAENVLLVGSDSRTGAGDQFAQAPKGQTQVLGQRSDTVILAHLAKGHGRATLVSLPRDSWVTIPAYTDANGVLHPAHQDKLNAAFALGGAALLVKTVQELTGLHIDHYVEIDFAGFQRMVDALGGVDVCLSRPAHDVNTGINLSAGWHHLNGAQALAFVRQRYGLPLGDLDRIKRQQQFLAAMMRKVESAGTLTNPLKLNAFLDAFTKSVTVDAGMSTADMEKLAVSLRGLSTGNVVLTTMPIAGFGTRNGESVDIVDTAKAQQLFAALAADQSVLSPSAQPSTLPRSQVHVRVFNAAGINGLAARASAELAQAGFDVIGTPANRGSGATTTVIEYPPAEAAAAHTLAAVIPGAVLRPNDQLSGEIDLLLGSDYHGLATSSSPSTTGTPNRGSGGSGAAGSTGGGLTGSATTAATASCTA